MESLEDMLPWERLVYLDLIKVQLEEERIRAIDAANAAKDQQSLIRKLKRKT